VLPKLDGSEESAALTWWADMLRRRTGEAVWIGELMAGQVHIVHQAVRPEDLVQHLGADGAIPWYACALGQAMVAGLDAAAREALLAVPGPHSTSAAVPTNSAANLRERVTSAIRSAHDCPGERRGLTSLGGGSGETVFGCAERGFVKFASGSRVCQ